MDGPGAVDTPINVEKIAQDGPPPNAPEASTNSSDRLAVLEHRIKTLESRQEGFWGWVKTWGGFIGLVAGCFGIPKAIVDARTAIWSRPESSIVLAYPITMHSNTGSNEFGITFQLTIRNNGPVDELVQKPWARLTPPTGAPLNFGYGDITIKEKDAKLDFPLTVNKNSARDITCELLARVQPTDI